MIVPTIILSAFLAAVMECVQLMRVKMNSIAAMTAERRAFRTSVVSQEAVKANVVRTQTAGARGCLFAAAVRVFR
jgi:hypothetical protein